MLNETGDGIWISTGDDATRVDLESDDEEEEAEQDRASESDEEGSQGDDFSDEEEEAESNEASVGGRFGALALEEAVTDSTEEE